ncbi:uncharacterized protein Z519_06777 [Cladophialophora bantiana CBS 173.52]|uniref:Glutathione S-transferase n=1 Tax=Cladophialophora bantiana (strain ATCC 10958 / CBS 173.52 / CDC B-1940 / NIH 8579) TaxID=1442370 RepID=A0A0D2HI52_CLAB1|nr:uncharacterized protein Z519_06777 [Cladophialophora bantiana CBS 173.52]KIW92928.1 hypothetical protein Z519_06777 [Cladophialophora bantiana CBS 173.52]
MSSTSHPDADIYPEATGPAAKIVAAHQKDEPITLYSGWFCPFVQRAWITLEEKKIPYKYVEINPYRKEPSFLKLNPRGLVPTLGCPQEDGTTKPLIESNIISEYLDEMYPDQTHLWPRDPYRKAVMRVWVDHITTRILPAYHRFLQHTEKSPYTLEKARSELLNALKTWISNADPEGPYFMGQDFTFGDIALAPWAVRMWVLDHFKGGLGIPPPGQGGEDEQLWNRWRKWSNAVTSRKSVTETMSNKEHYMPIYQRYAEDRAMSEMAKAIREGRGVP